MHCEVPLNTYRHRAVSALPASRAARSIGEFLVQDTECRHALAGVLLFTDTTVLTRRNLFIRVLEVATERRSTVKSAVAVLARADVGSDTCAYINVSWGASI